MQLIDNWKTVAANSYSTKFALGAAALSGMEVVNTASNWLPLLQGILPPGQFALLSALCGIAAAVLRLVKQSSVSGTQEPPIDPAG